MIKRLEEPYEGHSGPPTTLQVGDIVEKVGDIVEKVGDIVETERAVGDKAL